MEEDTCTLVVIGAEGSCIWFSQSAQSRVGAELRGELGRVAGKECGENMIEKVAIKSLENDIHDGRKW